MEIILLCNLRNVGKAGDIVTVKPGYSRNYLIPNKIAIYATEKNRKFFAEQKEAIMQENMKRHEGALEIASRIDNLIVSVIKPSGIDGKLFGSVTYGDIIDTVKAKSGILLEKKSIKLGKSIRYVGIYSVDIELHTDVRVTLKLNVAQSDGDADAALSHYMREQQENRHASISAK